MKDVKEEFKPLNFTGERYVPEVTGNIELEHIHRYLLAKQLVEGQVVLDIASGEGYGSAMLAQVALKVTGVDISEEAVAHAQGKYRFQNLDYLLGSCSEISLENGSVDVVVSFETIEHHAEHEAMMREIKRVLRPSGLLVISCPDKLEYSDKPGFNNEHHIKELYRDEFKVLLDAHFKEHSIYGQRVVYGSAIFCEDRNTPIGSYELADISLTVSKGVPRAIYLIAVASDADIPHLNSGILEQSINEIDVVKEREAAINQIIAERNSTVAGYEVAINQVIAERNSTVAEYEAAINQVIAERNSTVAAYEAVIIERDL